MPFFQVPILLLLFLDILRHRLGLPKGIDLVAKAPSELLYRQLVSAGMFRIDEVANGLSLSEVSFAMQKGPLREFAGQCRATSSIDKALHEPLCDEGAAVDVAFHNVFACEALGTETGEQQGFIEGLVSIKEDPQCCASWWTTFESALAQPVDHGPGLGSADADNGNSTASWRGGQGANRRSVKGMCRHGGKLARAPFRMNLAPRYFCDRATARHYHHYEYPTP